MRYLFRGLIRESGKPVVGHVEAAYPEEAFNALAENGIVTESLTPDPKQMLGVPGPAGGSQGSSSGNVADAIDSALDVSASQVNFDDLTERYRGKRVWVIDRDKIRRRVAQVVDQALQIAQGQSNTADQVRESVAKAIEGLFKDNANITSPADKVAQQQGGGGVASPELELKVDKLSHAVNQIGVSLANLSALVRNLPSGGFGGGGGGGGGPRRSRARAQRPQQNEVLLEIFRANMQLQRGVEMPAPGATPPAEGAPSEGAVDSGPPTDASAELASGISTDRGIAETQSADLDNEPLAASDSPEDRPTTN